jgi:sRNA-binding protein
VLREKWPVAFPVKGEDVRPLAISATDEIAATMGWSRPYTLGVLRHWKMTAAYCQAILRHVALDGAPAEPVGAEAKDMAAKQLARLAARKAATKAAKAAAPAAVNPPPAPTPPIETPPKTPEQLRSRVRAALLRRSA